MKTVVTTIKTVVRKRNIGNIFTGRDEIKKEVCRNYPVPALDAGSH